MSRENEETKRQKTSSSQSSRQNDSSDKNTSNKSVNNKPANEAPVSKKMKTETDQNEGQIFNGTCKHGKKSKNIYRDGKLAELNVEPTVTNRYVVNDSHNMAVTSESERLEKNRVKPSCGGKVQDGTIHCVKNGQEKDKQMICGVGKLLQQISKYRGEQSRGRCKLSSDPNREDQKRNEQQQPLSELQLNPFREKQRKVQEKVKNTHEKLLHVSAERKKLSEQKQVLIAEQKLRLLKRKDDPIQNLNHDLQARLQQKQVQNEIQKEKDSDIIEKQQQYFKQQLKYRVQQHQRMQSLKHKFLQKRDAIIQNKQQMQDYWQKQKSKSQTGSQAHVENAVDNLPGHLKNKQQPNNVVVAGTSSNTRTTSFQDRSQEQLAAKLQNIKQTSQDFSTVLMRKVIRKLVMENQTSTNKQMTLLNAAQQQVSQAPIRERNVFRALANHKKKGDSPYNAEKGKQPKAATPNSSSKIRFTHENEKHVAHPSQQNSTTEISAKANEVFNALSADSLERPHTLGDFGPPRNIDRQKRRHERLSKEVFIDNQNRQSCDNEKTEKRERVIGIKKGVQSSANEMKDKGKFKISMCEKAAKRPYSSLSTPDKEQHTPSRTKRLKGNETSSNQTLLHGSFTSVPVISHSSHIVQTFASPSDTKVSTTSTSSRRDFSAVTAANICISRSSTVSLAPSSSSPHTKVSGNMLPFKDIVGTTEFKDVTTFVESRVSDGGSATIALSSNRTSKAGATTVPSKTCIITSSSFSHRQMQIDSSPAVNASSFTSRAHHIHCRCRSTNHKQSRSVFRSPPQKCTSPDAKESVSSSSSIPVNLSPGKSAYICSSASVAVPFQRSPYSQSPCSCKSSGPPVSSDAIPKPIKPDIRIPDSSTLRKHPIRYIPIVPTEKTQTTPGISCSLSVDTRPTSTGTDARTTVTESAPATTGPSATVTRQTHHTYSGLRPPPSVFPIPLPPPLSVKPVTSLSPSMQTPAKSMASVYAQQSLGSASKHIRKTSKRLGSTSSSTDARTTVTESAPGTTGPIATVTRQTHHTYSGLRPPPSAFPIPLPPPLSVKPVTSLSLSMQTPAKSVASVCAQQSLGTASKHIQKTPKRLGSTESHSRPNQNTSVLMATETHQTMEAPKSVTTSGHDHRVPCETAKVARSTPKTSAIIPKFSVSTVTDKQPSLTSISRTTPTSLAHRSPKSAVGRPDRSSLTTVVSVTRPVVRPTYKISGENASATKGIHKTTASLTTESRPTSMTTVRNDSVAKPTSSTSVSTSTAKPHTLWTSTSRLTFGTPTNIATRPTLGTAARNKLSPTSAFDKQAPISASTRPALAKSATDASPVRLKFGTSVSTTTASQQMPVTSATNIAACRPAFGTPASTSTTTRPTTVKSATTATLIRPQFGASVSTTTANQPVPVTSATKKAPIRPNMRTSAPATTSNRSTPLPSATNARQVGLKFGTSASATTSNRSMPATSPANTTPSRSKFGTSVLAPTSNGSMPLTPATNTTPIRSKFGTSASTTTPNQPMPMSSTTNATPPRPNIRTSASVTTSNRPIPVLSATNARQVKLGTSATIRTEPESGPVTLTTSATPIRAKLGTSASTTKTTLQIPLTAATNTTATIATFGTPSAKPMAAQTIPVTSAIDMTANRPTLGMQALTTITTRPTVETSVVNASSTAIATCGMSTATTTVIQHTPGPSSLSEKETSDGDDGDCCVCFERPVNAALIQCGHLCMCYECALSVKTATGLCPMCREEIKEVLRVFKS